MMKSFTVAVFCFAVADAWGEKTGWSRRRSERKFLEFCSKNNKFPVNPEEFTKRENNFI